MVETFDVFKPKLSDLPKFIVWKSQAKKNKWFKKIEMFGQRAENFYVNTELKVEKNNKKSML